MDQRTFASTPMRRRSSGGASGGNASRPGLMLSSRTWMRDCWTAPSLKPGDELDGRYRIVRFIAAGGMGEVYEATDLALGTEVAVETDATARGLGLLARRARAASNP